jgi:hypothetical protein
LSSALVAIVLIASSAPAWANQTEQIEQLRAMLDEQDELDTEDAAKKDREMARKWLEEAEILVANGKEAAAKKRLRRVEFAVELVTALVAAAVIRQQAEEQEAAAYSSPDTLESLKQEVENLRKKKADLQRELQQLQQSTN